MEQGRNLLAIEVKMSSSVRYGDADSIRVFFEEYPNAEAGIVIYTGREVKYLDKRIIALPWQYLTGMAEL